MAITGQTFTNSFVVAGQKFYAADFLVLISEMQALNDEVVSEAIANAGNQSVGGVKTFSAIPVFAAGANMGSAKITAVLDPTAAQDAATKAYVDGLLAPVAKAWANVSANGTLSGNSGVASSSKTATGKYLITWDTAFASQNYAVIPSINDSIATHISVNSKATGSCIIHTYNSSHTLTDVSFQLAAFGGQ